MGNRYKFSIELIKDKKFYFELWAKSLNTDQVSVVTNLNFIISEFSNLFVGCKNYYETTWELDRNFDEVLISNIVISFFNSQYSIDYLEKQLDKDRKTGGWNSEYNF